MPKPKLIVIVAPSGAGKTTLARKLVSEFDQIQFSVSATTRPPRSYERDGIDYFFLSDEQFQKKIDEGDFLEWEEVFNNYRYGTLRSVIEKQMKDGYFPLLDVEVNGALNVKQQFGDRCISLFIRPPSLEVLRDRLTSRGTETEHSITYRLNRAEKELTLAHKFDHVIVNDHLDRAYDEIKSKLTPFLQNTQINH